MARAWVEDLWFTDRTGGGKQPTRRHGRGQQWRVRWYDDRRQLRAKAFPTKREAEAWRATVEHELREGSYRDRRLGEVPFAEVAREWIATRIDVTESSRRTYQAALDRYLIPAWGTRPVASIRRNELAGWLAGLSTELSPRSVIGIHRVLSMVLNWAVQTDRVVRNPAARLPLPRPTSAEQVYLTHAEVDALAEAAGAYRVMILTLAYTGLRFGEAAALKVASLDLPTRRLAVSQAWAGLNTGAPYLSTPKSHERRRVGLPSFLVHELEQFVRGRTPDEWLFQSPHGGVLNLSNWNRRVFAPALRQAGLTNRGLTPHSLRHTAASLAIASGADVKVVQNMLGHYAGDPGQVDHVWPRYRRAAVA